MLLEYRTEAIELKIIFNHSFTHDFDFLTRCNRGRGHPCTPCVKFSLTNFQDFTFVVEVHGKRTADRRQTVVGQFGRPDDQNRYQRRIVHERNVPVQFE